MPNQSINYAQSEGLTKARLDDAHISSWRDRGFALIHDLLPLSLLQTLKEDALAFYPAPNSAAAEQYFDFSSSQKFVFPSRSAAFNSITLHPALLQAVADLLNLPIWQLRLTQSDLWPKYAGADSKDPEANRDQRMHCDYPNHSLVHPPPWESPEAVEMIIYLNDYKECEGATAVVPRNGPDDPAYPWPIVQTPGVGDLDYINDRQAAEAYMAERDPAAAAFRQQHLYARELVAKYQFGSVLFYRHDTWHRGRPVKQDALRLVQNLTFTKTGRDWLSILHSGWSWSMYESDNLMERLIAQASVDQRTVLGFPPPGHDYWSPKTIAAVEARYQAFGIDMTAYKKAL